MIVRASNEQLLLITQPDHAALAARIIAAWNVNAFVPAASRPAVLFAIEQHDNGWREIDAAPQLNRETRRPYDFMSAPIEFKQAIWPRGVERLAASSPHAAALVAQHALTIHAHRRDDPPWRTFFEAIETRRSRLLHECGAEAGVEREAFERNYDLLYLGDLLSLVFCNGWTEPVETRGYRAVLHDGQVLVSPDPFDGRPVDVEVRARAIANRDYASDDELRRAWQHASIVELRGKLRGSRAE